MTEEKKDKNLRGFKAVATGTKLPSQAMPVATGRIEIPIEKLVDNPLNPRTFYLADKIQEMAESLKDKQLHPITVKPEGDKYVIVDGHYRVQGLRSIGKQTAWCDIDAGITGLDLLTVGREANVKRNAQNVFDDAIVFKKALEHGFATSHQELADKLKMSRTDVTKTLQLNDLPFEAMRRLSEKEGGTGLSVAYAILQLQKHVTIESEFLELIDRIVDENWGRNKIEAHGKLLATPQKGKKQSATPRAVFTGASGNKIGTLDTKGKKVSLSYSAVDEKTAEKIAQAIERIIAGLGDHDE
ncbi:MAG: ParB/RepB/Spo0J family partition protein [Thiotrichales bacterium]|nr:ParB/RepB/Spo0J family partition protein [Thiotrichales bacterium]